MKPQQHEVFYMVWCPSTGRTKVRHKDKQQAKNEAERLARQNRGQEFHVLCSVASVCVNDVMWTEYQR